MKKIKSFFLIALVFGVSGFADNLVLDNQTSYPNKEEKSKMAIQWANSEKEVEQENQALLAGSKLSKNKVQIINQTGKVSLTIPKKAEYFRVLTWSKGSENPDFHTNWVDVIPNKSYILKSDHLVPSVLMSGTGC